MLHILCVFAPPDANLEECPQLCLCVHACQCEQTCIVVCRVGAHICFFSCGNFQIFRFMLSLTLMGR